MSGSDANSRQVGGKHYKSKYEHWDWVTDIGMGYLPAQVTKYLKRWQDKNGLQDVQKSGHFMDKMIEVSGILVRHQPNLSAAYVRELTERYVAENGIEGLERQVTFILSRWQTVNDLHTARDFIAKLEKKIANPAIIPITGNRGSGTFVDSDESIHAKT